MNYLLLFTRKCMYRKRTGCTANNVGPSKGKKKKAAKKKIPKKKKHP